MKCLECGYPLWNLREGRCPECATKYDATRWVFPTGSVRFGCPHCEHEFSEARTVRDVRSFTCPECGERFTRQQLRVIPLDDPDSIRCRYRRPRPFLNWLAWHYASMLAFPVTALVILLLLFPAPSGRGFATLPFPFGYLGLVLGVGVLGVALIHNRKRRIPSDGRRLVVAGVFYSIVVVIAIALIAFWMVKNRSRRIRSWNWQTFEQLRTLHAGASFYYEQNGLAPPSYLDLVKSRLLSVRDVIPSGAGMKYEVSPLMVGDVPVGEFVDGVATLADLGEPQFVPPTQNRWEAIGGFLLDRVVISKDGEISEKRVIGISIPNPYGDGETRTILFDDIHVEIIRDYSAWRVRYNETQSDLPGFVAIPDWP